jgi:hypothetical protein
MPYGAEVYMQPITQWGRKFFHPILAEDGILVCDYCFDWRAEEESNSQTYENDGLVERWVSIREKRKVYGAAIARSEDVFDFPGYRHPPKIVWEHPEVGKVRLIPATAKNLKLLTELPYIDDDSRELASELLLFYSKYLERRCLNFLVNKHATAPVGDAYPLHRMPAKTTIEEVESFKELTPSEKLAVGMGKKKLSDFKVVNKVEKHEHILTEWLRYARAYRPYSQQVWGAEELYRLRYLLIWYDMRTGKTLTAIMANKRFLEEGSTDLVLVVCPKSNMYNPWVEELEKEGLDVRILDGTTEEDLLSISERSKQDDTLAQRGRPNAYVINYERLGSRLWMMDQHWDMTRVGVVLDESSAIKNPSSSRSKAAHSLCCSRNRPYSVSVLNGTPMEQGPIDFWSQAHCIDPYGLLFEPTFGRYKDKWLYEVGQGKWVPSDKLAFEMLVATTGIRYVRGEADQFSGRDKNLRYVSLKATKQMVEQSENVQAGFVAKADGTEQELAPCILSTYGFLREICSGYDKFREVEHGPYIRQRHEIDPKLLWLRCWIESHPTEPLVVYLEYDEQEERLKEMLDEMKVSWSGTKEKGQYRRAYRLREDTPEEIKSLLYTYTLDQQKLAVDRGTPIEELVPVPTTFEELRHHPGALMFCQQNWQYGRYLETYYGYIKGKKYGGRDRAEQIRKFNEGEVHVFICKTAEARGFSLSRKEAVAAGIGGYPTIVALCPTWKLGDWEQSQDRCVTTDMASKKSVCTMVYLLCIAGSIEEKVAIALRQKKDVQQTLLQDTSRKGFFSFVQDLIDGMREGAGEKGQGTEFFDAEEMYDRILCGVPPESKLTENLVLTKLTDKLKANRSSGVTSKATCLKWLLETKLLEDDKMVVEAYNRLVAKAGGTSVTLTPVGVAL